MESFLALLQRNVLDRPRSATRDELRIAIVTWIERTYHRRRRQTALGRLTPIEYEIINTHRPRWPPDPTCHLNTRQSRSDGVVASRHTSRTPARFRRGVVSTCPKQYVPTRESCA